jgi:hypothetical protein
MFTNFLVDGSKSKMLLRSVAAPRIDLKRHEIEYECKWWFETQSKRKPTTNFVDKSISSIPARVQEF